MHLSHCLANSLLLHLHQDVLDLVDGRGIADVLHELLGNRLALAGEMAGLQVVDSLPHVPVGNEEQGLKGLLSNPNVLAFNDSLKVELHFIILELPEA